MNTEKLDLFVKIVEIGNLTRAAEVMGYTQSGATHIINSLEKELGVRLLERGRSGSKLTDEGARLFELAKEVVHWEKQLLSLAENIRKDRKTTLRVAALPSVCRNWLPLISERMQALDPNLKIDIFASDNKTSEQLVVTGRVDVAFICEPAHKSLTSKHIGRDPFVVVLPRNHPLMNKERISLRDLTEYDYIKPLNDSHDVVNDAIDASGLVMNTRYIAYTIRDVVNWVEEGFGISVLPLLGIGKDRREVELRPIEEGLHRDISIAVQKNRKITPMINEFIAVTLGLFDEGVIG